MNILARSHVSIVILSLLAATAEEALGADPDSAAATDSEGQAHDYFYVSTEGNDDWSGSLPGPAVDGSDGPLATLAGAQQEIRRRVSQGEPENPVTIMVLDGTYRMSRPLVLDRRDTGSGGRSFTITAYPGHQPVLNGSLPVAGWQPYQEKILQCDLPRLNDEPWNFRQLFFQGNRQIRARWPNRDPDDPLYGGWAFVETMISEGEPGRPQFRFTSDSAPQEWAKPVSAEVQVFPWYCWVNDLIPLQQVNLNQQALTLGRNVRFGMSLMPGNRFYVENVLEELDQPGEWCLDSEASTLYFWPPTEDMADELVSAPMTDSLIELRGTPGQPLRNVTISGLTFAETVSPFPDHMHDSHHSPTLRGAAVTLEECEHCRIDDNLFRNIGGDAIRLHGPNRHNRIAGNEISHVGGSGVSLASHGPMNTHVWNDKAEFRRVSAQYPRLVSNVITNNHIHHCGVIKKNCGGVQLFAINSVDTLISHNLIHDMSDKGMIMQDGFGRFIVEYNEMYRLGLEIADTGGLMTNRWFVLEDDPDLSHGNIVRYNLIRDCIGCGAYTEQRNPKGEGDRIQANGRIWAPYYTWGIYFDNSGRDITVYGNIVISTVLGAVSMPVGEPQNIRIENNIFIGSSGNQVDLRTGSGARGNRFQRNIIYYTDPDAMLLAARASVKQTLAVCDHNIYFHAAGGPLQIRGIGDGTFAEWKKLGFDEHSLVTDPLFVDASGGDYRLRPDSPAYGLGFRPIPLERIGLQDQTGTNDDD